MKIGKKFLQIVLVTFLIEVPITVSAQTGDSVLSEQIAIVTRPSKDSITLRWAPLSYHAWSAGVNFGYRVERFVIARNGSLVEDIEKTVLCDSVKTLPEAAWETLVRNNRYAAIAAQALYGDQFELDLQHSDIFTIADKVRENEQRFAFALFSADMSPDVAKASGLWFADTTVNKDDKYLYRITANGTDKIRGSVFISPDDDYLLPPPQKLTAEFNGHRVSLKWDRTSNNCYTAYRAERSDDGKVFTPISETPQVTISSTEKSDTQYEYATDSLPEIARTYYYRVKGITPFGDEGPASEVVSGRSPTGITQVPHLLSVETFDNATMTIRWEFPEESNAAIAGFTVERASGPRDKYTRINAELIKPNAREYKDISPNQVNYYRVSAVDPDHKSYQSLDYFAQLIDSIPPSRPTGLNSTIDNEGNLSLRWDPNMEPDLAGYRVYRAYHESEEFALVTDSSLTTPSFEDQISLNTLNEHIYYRVMALDKNQNHSVLSGLLKVSLPDKVKPQPPVLLPVATNEKGIVLSWVQGASTDIVRYKVYRKTLGSPGWLQIKELHADSDSTYTYVDESISPRIENIYTVISVDESGLESDPAQPLGTVIAAKLRVRVAWRKPKMDPERNQVKLSWSYPQQGIDAFQIYRIAGASPPILLAIVPGSQSDFTDTLIPGKAYIYRIMASFSNGDKSELSDELVFKY